MKDRSWKEKAWNWGKAFLIALLLAVFIRSFILLPMTIEGSSMIPTLQPGDQIIVETMYNIERFDIVVFRGPTNRILIKRVVGLPGESIRYENDQLFINEVALEEPYLDNELVESTRGDWTSDFTLVELTGSLLIPEGEYFVLGDNRRLSNDSRYFGTVTNEALIGETRLIYYPFSRFSFLQ